MGLPSSFQPQWVTGSIPAVGRVSTRSNTRADLRVGLNRSRLVQGLRAQEEGARGRIPAQLLGMLEMGRGGMSVGGSQSELAVREKASAPYALYGFIGAGRRLS